MGERLNRKQRRARARAEKQHLSGSRRDASGRVHLELHRDALSGVEHLTLKKPVFKEAWQNEIVTGAANTAYGIFQRAPTLERAVDLAKNAMSAMSKLSAGLLARAPEGSVACRSGCDHCCYQSVGVTAPEALAIFDHLRATRSKDELAAVTEHVTQSYERTRHLSTPERFSPEHPCPFLAVESGQCTIYEVRPLSCRGMNSLDATECSTRLRDPEARAEFLKVGFGGHSYMEPIRAFHAISAGLQLGLSEIYGLDMRPLDLTAALHLLLTGDESISREWLEGRRAFEEARGGDSSTSLGGQELSGILTPGE